MYVDFNKLKKRYDEFWAMENHDRPLITLFAPKKDVCWNDFPNPPEKILDRWFDIEYNIKKSRFYMNNTTIYCGEAFPSAWVNFGPDIMGAICGTDIEFGEDTSWATHSVKDWKDCRNIQFDSQNKWFKVLQQFTKAYAEDSKGDYVVGITDLHPGMDGVVSLRGPENTCMDMFDNPDEIMAANLQIYEVFKKVFDAQYSAATKYLPYTTNWMNIFSSDKEYVTSCDFSCLISKSNYEDFVIPELIKELDFLDSSVYHLDGVAALTHLDRLCELKKLKGIQWVPGAGQKPMREWLDVLKKIQNSGKIIDITVEYDDIEPICRALKPEGVIMHYCATSEEQAHDILKMMTDASKK